MKMDIGVLKMFMEARIFGESDAPLVVGIDCYWVEKREPKALRKSTTPNQFLCSLAKRHALSFCRRECNALLLIRFPANSANADFDHKMLQMSRGRQDDFLS